ncbi:NAD(P)H-hydrate dehydratase [Gordonia sp. X0973]|uniref:NAD(P)H-hydrate dehydratase n=1 Tax=Gordonia sp. X0973 TaxID=2742602 RepID=UPI000F52D3BB|nr:NAD(P)H-hydrate dehydratase [Gordonia sp. X0973]QKT06666.1 NAD(P)H-hydrate dehydratase [Gordonia sp. X0973]
MSNPRIEPDVRYPTVAQIRDAEAATGLLAGGVLMSRAAHGVASAIIDDLRATGGVYGRRVGLVVGSGDNGGDALFAGGVLARRGVAVSAVLLAPDRAHRGGLAALRAAGGRVVAEFGELDVVVDGVVGIGGTGPLRPPAAAVFDAVGTRSPRARVVAVDLPSGVDADTGEVHEPAVRADLTVTFGVPRRAHVLAAPQCGRIVVVDIGLGHHAADGAVLGSLSDAQVGAAWPVPGPFDDKYRQGVVGIVAGSARYPGAALLCTGAAVAATSGMTRYAGPAAAAVVDHHPEVVVADEPERAGKVQAWVVGPGFGTDDAALIRLRTVLAADVPVLVDADGITLLAQHRELLAARTAPTLLTPHAGEFARLTGEPLGPDRVAAVAACAAEFGATVLLKGRATVIAAADHSQVLVNEAGSSWAATAGSGDALAGIIGALLATGLQPAVAAAMGARAHSVAAHIAAGSPGAPIGASSLVAAISDAIRTLRGQAGPASSVGGI